MNLEVENMQREFPEFKELTLEDITFLKERIWNHQPELSELTFTNLFIWKDHFKFKWTMLDNDVIFMALNEDKPYFLEPVGEIDSDDIKKLSLWLKTQYGSEISFKMVGNKFVSKLDSDFTVRPMRDQFDYVYKADDMINLSGRKYHSKRNHLMNFFKNYRYEYKPMTDSDTAKAIELAQKWCQANRCKDDMNLLNEFEATKSALENFKTFGLIGGMILIEGKIEAFTLGELLNDKTMVIHIEKANKEFDGIYVAINNLFCKNNLKDGMFVNREQDLGDEGLRKAKLSYFPDHMVEKFEVIMQNLSTNS